MPIKSIREFIKLETAAGIILVVMAVLALILDNSPLREYYNLLITTRLSIHIGSYGLSKPTILWINDGLMAIFFLLVGLEIKREILVGELSTSSKLVLPGVAAIGGMLVPALIYVLINLKEPQALRGWAIPTATDIAFALGILALLRSRVPVSLKIFLTALAILDDIGAIVIIAAFYTSSLSFVALSLAVLCTIILLLFNRWGVIKLTPYIIVGIVLWFCVLKSGVHATLAGVVLAFTIPLEGDGSVEGYSPLRSLEHTLHPWVAYGVLPLFAFANAGVSFSGTTIKDFFHSIPMGIALGLLLGKQIGVFFASWICVKFGFANMPTRANWTHIYGISLLCGVGFTMSLFIGMLAFDKTNTEFVMYVRMGVLSGSILSGLLGYYVLRTCPLRT